MIEKPIVRRLDWGLSSKESQLIGMIIAEWAALEDEVCRQLMESCQSSPQTGVETKLAQNFSENLKNWKMHVVDVAEKEVAEKLRLQSQEIERLVEYRNALAHGMWTWNGEDVTKITSVRVKQKKLLLVHFTRDDLLDMFNRAAAINFNLRFPLGDEDFGRAMIESGGFVARSFFLTDDCTEAEA